MYLYTTAYKANSAWHSICPYHRYRARHQQHHQDQEQRESHPEDGDTKYCEKQDKIRDPRLSPNEKKGDTYIRVSEVDAKEEQRCSQKGWSCSWSRHCPKEDQGGFGKYH